MSFFRNLLNSRGQNIKHDGRPLWKYLLSDDEFKELKACIEQTNFHSLDPRDITLYFAEWWKRNYKGGKPSIEDVFNSLNIPVNKILTEDLFYELAKQGAQLLGIRWIRRQYTLYFRTLLLQGGIPINHITLNAGYYLNFLIRLIEIQPNSVEEIVLNTELTKLLPVSSRNETIYENCLEIINSFINNEDDYKEIFEKNDALKKISDELNIRKKKLERSNRIQRSKIFWAMTSQNEKTSIYLKIGFANQYDAESLKQLLNIESDPIERFYQIYINDKRVCTFRRMLSGSYKTHWDFEGNFNWNFEKVLPQFYWISDNTKRHEITDMLSVQPTLDEPTLWVSIDENEWRLVKGNTVKLDEAFVLHPQDWMVQNENVTIQYLVLNEQELCFSKFSNTITLFKNDTTVNFTTNSQPFEWTILSEKPGWMRNANMPVITQRIYLQVYDENERLVPNSVYNINFKSRNNPIWQKYDKNVSLPPGLIDLKIEYNGKEAFDRVFNIANLTLEFIDQTINSAELAWNNKNGFNIEVSETIQYNVIIENNHFIFELDLENNAIPASVTFKIKLGTNRSLYFDINSPFSGIGLLDKDGTIMNDKSIVPLTDLYGLRLLTSKSGETNIKMWNHLRPEVKIFKNVSFTQQPLISFKDHLQRLFYLADAMRHDNIVEIDVSNANNSFTFFVKGFTHTINDVDNQLEGKVFVNDGRDLQLLAVSLNVAFQEIQILGLSVDEEGYHHLPNNIDKGQFIVFSTNNGGKQLQPRFINTQPDIIISSKEERIVKYHNDLLESDFKSSHWQELKTYYDICVEYKIPFSTFDQIRAIGSGSMVAAKAFFFLGVHQRDVNEYIQLQIPALEQDLGFCFHWIKKNDWNSALESTITLVGDEQFNLLVELMKKYFNDIGLPKLTAFLSNGLIDGVERVTNQIINEERSKLGQRVLNELPKFIPHCTSYYGIRFDNHEIIKLLLRSPMAAAESITDKEEKSIWLNDPTFVAILRRNIQYAQYIAPGLYTQVLYHTLANPQLQ